MDKRSHYFQIKLFITDTMLLYHEVRICFKHVAVWCILSVKIAFQCQYWVRKMVCVRHRYKSTDPGARLSLSVALYFHKE